LDKVTQEDGQRQPHGLDFGDSIFADFFKDCDPEVEDFRILFDVINTSTPTDPL
jgi:hypothetical protein